MNLISPGKALAASIKYNKIVFGFVPRTIYISRNYFFALVAELREAGELSSDRANLVGSLRHTLDGVKVRIFRKQD